MYFFEWSPEKNFAVGPDGNHILDESGKPKTLDFGLTGSVKVRVPTHMDRLSFLRSVQFGISDGEVQAQAAINQTEAMMDWAMKHIESVNLRRKEDGFEFKDADALLYDADGASVLASIAAKMAKGVKLGKS